MPIPLISADRLSLVPPAAENPSSFCLWMLHASLCPRTLACAVGVGAFFPCSFTHGVSYYLEVTFFERCFFSNLHGSSRPVPLTRFILRVAHGVPLACLSTASHLRLVLMVALEQGLAVSCCTLDFENSHRALCVACVLLKESPIPSVVPLVLKSVFTSPILQTS